MNAAVDTSVVVAGLCAWHPDHQAAKAVLVNRPTPLAHVLLESYSVLTRLPAPRRLDPQLVLSALERLFPSKPVGLPTMRLVALLRRLASHGICGGATYDALVGESARYAKVALHTLDTRARPIYEVVGVDVLWVT
jgi:toxin FitB